MLKQIQWFQDAIGFYFRKTGSFLICKIPKCTTQFSYNIIRPSQQLDEVTPPTVPPTFSRLRLGSQVLHRSLTYCVDCFCLHLATRKVHLFLILFSTLRKKANDQHIGLSTHSTRLSTSTGSRQALFVISGSRASLFSGGVGADIYKIYLV